MTVLDPWFQEYVNLREEFRKFLPIFPFKPHEPPLQVMLQALSLSFVGKHHSGTFSRQKRLHLTNH